MTKFKQKVWIFRYLFSLYSDIERLMFGNAPNTKKKFDNSLEFLEDKRSRRIYQYWRNRRILLVALFIGILLLFFAVYFYNIDNKPAYTMCIAYSVLFFLFARFIPIKLLQNQIDKIDSEIDFLRAQKLKENEKAERIFKYHQSELKRYYEQTLDHSGKIFWTGIICLIFGFIIIGATLFILISLDTLFKVKNEQDARLIISIFGGISTILSNFIGVIYLRMYSETIKSLSTFHSRLVTTHHLHLANCLNSKIDDPKLKDKTCSQMAMEIIKSSHLEEFNKYISDTSVPEKK